MKRVSSVGKRRRPAGWPGSLARGLAALIGAAAVFATPVAAEGRDAALVLDANSGKVLFSRAADALRYPASLTKMMTLYLVFERLERGELTLATRVRISERAASVQPSKLDLEEGETISVENAIRALVVKSANDIAVALAEHLGGSEARFADLMTTRARSLGMSRTVFRNAHGLPNAEQVTTARDMATLGMALADHFPHRWAYFATRTFAYDGNRYRNHNSLLHRMEGVDGIKTGYTRASGFNLVSSIRRDGRHVVAVVLGGTSAGRRDAEMRRLLTQTVPGAARRKTRPPVLVAGLAKPPRRAARPKTMARGEPRPRPPESGGVVRRSPAPLEASVASGGGGPRIEIARVRPVLLLEPRPAMRRPLPVAVTPVAAEPVAVREPLPEKAAVVLGRPPSTLEAQSRAMRSALRGPGVGSIAAVRPRDSSELEVALQVGSFPSREGAERQLAHVLTLAGPLLRGHAGESIPARVNGRFVYRARFRGFAGADGTRACTELRRRQIDCFVTRTN
jgi:D-alanyl-D-alanine carboxypeptidase